MDASMPQSTKRAKPITISTSSEEAEGPRDAADVNAIVDKAKSIEISSMMSCEDISSGDAGDNEVSYVETPERKQQLLQENATTSPEEPAEPSDDVADEAVDGDGDDAVVVEVRDDDATVNEEPTTETISSDGLRKSRRNLLAKQKTE